MDRRNEAPQLHWYWLPPVPREGWAMIVIGSNGYFSACSDFGNYAFIWSHHGCDDARQFFLRAPESWDYFVSKLCPQPHEFDGEATFASIAQHILSHRRDGDWTRERARQEWDLLQEHSDMRDLGGLMDYGRWYDQTKIDCAYEYAVYSPPSNAVSFCKIIMKRLADVLREELKAEGKAA